VVPFSIVIYKAAKDDQKNLIDACGDAFDACIPFSQFELNKTSTLPVLPSCGRVSDISYIVLSVRSCISLLVETRKAGHSSTPIISLTIASLCLQ
jgi:hypothetical protein